MYCYLANQNLCKFKTFPFHKHGVQNLSPGHVDVILPVGLEHHVQVAGQIPVLSPQRERGVRLLKQSG